MAPLVPPSYLPYIANSAAAVGCIPLLAGVGILWRPQTALDIAEFPSLSAQASASDRRLLDGVLKLFGVRDLFLGGATLAVWYNHAYGANATAGGYRTLGWVMAGASMVVFTDGLVSRAVIGGGELKHWGFLPFSLGIWAALWEVI